MKSCVFVTGAVSEVSATCGQPGKSRYISFETLGNEHFCAESCLRGSEFEALLPFTDSLAPANHEAPCEARGYETLVSSELHAKGPFFRSVDLYAQEDTALQEPCCGTCPPEAEKHWAISGAACVERCVSASEADRLAVFQSGFQRSESILPCRDAGFEQQFSTEIDAVGPYFALSDKFVMARSDVLA